ncbi:MAG: leucyl aminopeptidase [bacterium]|nr:leucyl aminopeptidase [bacterium]
MKINVLASDVHTDFENIIVMATADGEPEFGECAIADKPLMLRVIEMGDFSGKRGSCLLVYGEDGRRWAMTGLGAADKINGRAWRAAAAAAQKKLAATGAISAALILPLDADVAEVAAGLTLSGYKYDDLISKKAAQGKHLEEVTLLLPEGADIASIEETLSLSAIHLAGTQRARDLMYAPGNIVNPDYLAAESMRIAAKSEGRVKTTVMNEAALAEGKFDALLAVGRGSVNDSHLVIMEYTPHLEEIPEKTVVLVGKGVTFDTGGISLKPVALMEEMKYDMGGAAAVLGLFHALSKLDLPVRVIGLVPTVENMPGSQAYRPGDVIVSRSGLSIEVISTDAEGRVIMADALDYASKWEPDLLIDLATLTGATVVGLGHECAGMMSNEKGAAFEEALKVAGEKVGERVWSLPMFEEYGELIKSDVADMKNSGGRYGGGIAAGKFLQRFADHAPWIHLDIAGTAYLGKEREHNPKGGNGFGVRLLLEFLENFN